MKNDIVSILALIIACTAVIVSLYGKIEQSNSLWAAAFLIKSLQFYRLLKSQNERT